MVSWYRKKLVQCQHIAGQQLVIHMFTGSRVGWNSTYIFFIYKWKWNFELQDTKKKHKKNIKFIKQKMVEIHAFNQNLNWISPCFCSCFCFFPVFLFIILCKFQEHLALLMKAFRIIYIIPFFLYLQVQNFIFLSIFKNIKTGCAPS